jgi:hypothetical protein
VGALLLLLLSLISSAVRLEMANIHTYHCCCLVDVLINQRLSAGIRAFSKFPPTYFLSEKQVLLFLLLFVKTDLSWLK